MPQKARSNRSGLWYFLLRITGASGGRGKAPPSLASYLLKGLSPLRIPSMTQILHELLGKILLEL